MVSSDAKTDTNNFIKHEKKIKVSVCVITYNQEKYIRQCLSSIIGQKTDFVFEVVVGDDCSIDDTREIVQEFGLKYPEIVKPIFHERNIGGIKNYLSVHSAACGEYVAICEGDDYWIDPYKLQKQVHFLDSNPDYGMVYSRARVYLEKDQRFKKQCFGKPIASFDDLLLGNYISTPTVLMRKEMYFSYLEEIRPDEKQWTMGDYPLWLWIAANSKIKYFDDTFSVYRVIEESVSHSKDVKRRIQFINSFMEIRLFFMKKYSRDFLEKKIWGYYFAMKSNVYVNHHENCIEELISEMERCSNRSLKIKLIQILVSNSIFRKALKTYLSAIEKK